MNNHQAITREMINKAVTPEEERAYLTWWAARPPEEAIAIREYSVAMRGLFGPIQGFMDKNVDPAAPEVQALVDHWLDCAANANSPVPDRLDCVARFALLLRAPAPESLLGMHLPHPRTGPARHERQADGGLPSADSVRH